MMIMRPYKKPFGAEMKPPYTNKNCRNNLPKINHAKGAQNKPKILRQYRPRMT